jgi:HEAT repeat protein
MLEKAFESLKTYDWGQDRNVLKPIDDAVVAAHGDASARQQLENRLAETLKSELSYDARQFLCRKLMVIGTAASVPVLSGFLTDEKLSHMARYALERIPAPEAAKALRDALPKLSGALKVGVIASLGVRQDEAAVPLLAELLSDSDPAIARAAAAGLGAIRSPAASKALVQGKASSEAQSGVADAKLACAEALLSNGNSKDALAVYRGLIGSQQPKHVKLAATRGMLACAAKK